MMNKFIFVSYILICSQCVFATDKEIDWPNGSIPFDIIQEANSNTGNITVLKGSIALDDIELEDVQNSLAILCEKGQSLNNQLIHIISDQRYFEDEDLKSALLANPSDPMDASGIEHRKWQEFAEEGWVATYQPETRWLVLRPWSGHDTKSVQLGKQWCK